MRKIHLIAILTLSILLTSSCSTPPATTPPTTVTSATINPVETTVPIDDQAQHLYPAYQYLDGIQKWGYIDPTGQFVIVPQYELTADFQASDLALFRQGGKSGLLNRQGEVIVAPAYDDIGNFTDGRAIALNWGDKTVSTLLDESGQVIAQINGYIFGFSEDLASVYVVNPQSGNGTYGYIDKTGKTVIPADYTSAGEFENGRALVSTVDGASYYIDQSGQKVADYIAPDPNTPYPLAYNKTFDDGLKIEGHQQDFLDYYGLFGPAGETLIPDTMLGIERFGDKLFAAAKATETVIQYQFLPKALYDNKGNQLTDFMLYDLGIASPEYFYVTDRQFTYLIDQQGAEYKALPRIRGNGTLQITDGLVKALVDQTLAYYTLDGQRVWQADDAYTLDSGVQVTRQKFSPSRFLLIFYPKLSGLSDPAVEEQINTQLDNAFTDEKQFTRMDGSPAETGEIYNTIDFAAEQFNNLLVIHKTGYDYPVGAAHGQPLSQYFHLDAQTGLTYELADLFKSGLDYKTRLEDLISQQITEQEANQDLYFDNRHPELNANNFKINADSLDLYYSPYEIAAYAAGFPTFNIPYSEIQDLIDTEGALWQSLKAK